jgi:hypothetical protein
VPGIVPANAGLVKRGIFEEEGGAEVARMASLSFASLDAALDAGWYLLWRFGLWMVGSLFAVFLLVRYLALSGVVDGTVAHVLTHSVAELAFILALVPWILRLNHLVGAWTRARHGRHLATSIRWSLLWRAGLITFPIMFGGGILGTLAEDALGSYPRILRVFNVVIAVATLIAVMIGVGWAMLTVAAKQIRGRAQSRT